MNDKYDRLQKQIQSNILAYQDQIRQRQNNLQQQQKSSSNEQEQKLLLEFVTKLQESLKSIQYVPVDHVLKQTIPTSLEDYRLAEKRRSEIFSFYCKLMYSSGAAKDFESIGHDTQVMSLGKFMIMCRQFGILRDSADFVQRGGGTRDISTDQSGRNQYVTPLDNTNNNNNKNNNYNINRLTRQELKDLFQRYANDGKEISSREFDLVMEQVAMMMYNNADESVKLFQNDILKINRKDYLLYLKGLNNAFFGREKIQYPNIDGKNTQKREGDEFKKRLVEEWRRMKQEEAHNQHLNNVLSRSRIAKPISFNSQKNLNQKNPTNYHKISIGKSNKRIQHQSQKITWSSLTQLDYGQLFEEKDEPFQPLDLIEDDLVDFKKQYNHQIEMPISHNNKGEMPISHVKYRNIKIEMQQKIRDVERMEKQRYKIHNLYPKN